MQLVVLTEEFYPHTSGGAHTRWRFCQLAADRGHEVTVFTPHEPELAQAEDVDGVEIRRPFQVKPEGTPVYSPVALVTRIAASVLLCGYLWWWLHGREIDGLHSASHLTHWVAKTLSLLYSLPLVSFIGYTPSVDPDPSFTPKLLLERVNFRLFMGDAVFCRTPHVKHVIEARTNGEIGVLHGILDSGTLTQVGSNPNSIRTRGEENETVFVYVGRLVPIKNPVGAIEMLSRLPPEYTLVVVGDGSEREAVESAVHEYGVESRVRIRGELPHEETLATIAGADALILSSHAESYGAVVFEALSLSTDVFATPVGLLPTIDHPRLHLCSVDNLPEMISQTTLDSNGGLDTDTLERFSMERYTDEMLAAFEKLLAIESSGAK